MKHYIKSVGYDGELYHYVCSCGAVISTADGQLPEEHGQKLQSANDMIQSEPDSQ